MSDFYKNKKTGLIVRRDHAADDYISVTLPGGISANLNMRPEEFEEQFEPYDNTELNDCCVVTDDSTLVVTFSEASPPGFGEPFYLLKRIVVNQNEFITAFRGRATVYKDSRKAPADEE